VENWGKTQRASTETDLKGSLLGKEVLVSRTSFWCLHSFLTILVSSDGVMRSENGLASRWHSRGIASLSKSLISLSSPFTTINARDRLAIGILAPPFVVRDRGPRVPNRGSIVDCIKHMRSTSSLPFTSPHLGGFRP
jgi:hypothetical protein